MSVRAPHAVLFACLLGGCAALPALDGGAALDAAQTTELLRFLANAARAEPGERVRVLARAAAGCDRPAPDPACLRLGALYAQPEAGLRNDARARELLAPFAARAREATGPDGSTALAALLLAQVGERERIEQHAAKNEEALRTQGEALRKRLDAISTVERENIEREDRARERAGRAPAGRPPGR